MHDVIFLIDRRGDIFHLTARYIYIYIYILALDISSNSKIYALLTKHEVKMAGYWPSSFFAFLWTETKSRFIKTQKKNEANKQPS